MKAKLLKKVRKQYEIIKVENVENSHMMNTAQIELKGTAYYVWYKGIDRYAYLFTDYNKAYYHLVCFIRKDYKKYSKHYKQPNSTKVWYNKN